ncbi:MAG TPA: tetratricopeptide repeat protein [Alphaproteobacteria bacterium]
MQSIGEIFQQALRIHQSGRLPEAEALYRQVLAADPNNADALHLLGVVAHQVGRHDLAVDHIGRAIRLQPSVPHYRVNLGNALRALGRLAEAEASYRDALKLKPDFADAYGNLGGVLRRLGRLDEAKASYEEALRLTPAFPEAQNNLGNVLKDLGRLDDAEASYREALRQRPNYAEAQNNLGILQAQRRDFAKAAAAFEDAISAKPDFAAAYDGLGFAQLELGDYTAAFASFRSAIRRDPGHPQFWANWADCMSRHAFSFVTVDAQIFDDLLQLLDQPETQAKIVAQTIFAALRHHPEFSQVVSMSVGAGDYARTAQRLSAIPLLLRVLELAAVNDPEVERSLTVLRRALLEDALSGRRDIGALPFSAVLAQQCFLNEYMFAETSEEAATAERLAAEIAALLERGEAVPPAWIAALGAYRALHDFAWAPKLLQRQWPDEIDTLLRVQVREPLAERSLQGAIASLSPVKDTVSQAVRGQYEENPYPRWTKAGLHLRAEPLERIVRQLFPQAEFSARSFPERSEILIAGCGTGRQAIDAATKYANARILAVDLSRASLAYAVRKTQELGVGNVEYAQADILELGALTRRFDVIECAGVLHHLRDPLAGWRVLTTLLRDAGLMRIGLYSETARRSVVKARAWIAAQGYSSSPQDIRRCREHILRLAADPAAAAAEPELAGLAQWGIYSLSECRDLLFHVQEHRFTLRQISSALTSLGLEFLGFEDRLAIQAFRRRYPEPAALTSLVAWHDFETANPDTFIGMYQFWCRKA